VSVTQSILTPAATTLLERKPKRMHADFLMLITISMSINSSSQMVTRVCTVLTDGASRIISSAYRKIAAQHAPILQPLFLIAKATNLIFRLNVQVTAYRRQTVLDRGVVRSCDPLQNFGAPLYSLERLNLKSSNFVHE